MSFEPSRRTDLDGATAEKRARPASARNPAGKSVIASNERTRLAVDPVEQLTGAERRLAERGQPRRQLVAGQRVITGSVA